MGAAFGHTLNEPDDRIVDPDELVRSVIDVVSKNGNLLLNVGPDAAGRITPREQVRLDALADWMAVGAPALVGSRPWVRAEGRTGEGIDLRHTQTDGLIHTILLDTPAAGSTVSFPDLAPLGTPTIELLGHGDLDVTPGPTGPTVTWPDHVPTRPAHPLRITP